VHVASAVGATGKLQLVLCSYIYHNVTLAIKCRLIDDSLYQNLLILNQDCWSYLKM